MRKVISSKFSHGGNIWQIAEKEGILPEKIIDFSANINPWGASFGVVEAIKENLRDIFYYPDPECKRLTCRLSELLRLNQSNILMGNGATEIIYLTMRALKPARAIIPVPTFTEYERALKLSGCRVKFLFLKEEKNFHLDIEELIKEAKGVQMVVLCNPNNPTANLLPREKVEKVLNEVKKLGAILLVDESFIDFQPRHSLLDKIKNNPNLLILRSFTKFFSIPGLRLGYGVGSKRLIAKIRSVKEPWTVNSLAQIAGVQILKNIKKAERLKERIKKESKFLYNQLCRIKGLSPYPPQANFIFIKIKAPLSSSKLKDEMIKRGILIRDCSNFPGLSDKFIRIAVKKREENKKFINSLKEVIGGWA